jgi:DNA-binding transcriptional regulator YhcF (GntR family)
VQHVKAELIRRLNEGRYDAGQRFLSNRVLASRHDLSYQTADRLIRELAQEGYLERRAASGTYVPGRTPAAHGACLCLHSRSRRAGSFGERLLQELKARLGRDGISSVELFDDEADSDFPEGWYPVLWEWSGRSSPRGGLLLHRRPASGMDSTYWDSVTVDDFSGGVCAAQLLRMHVPQGRKWVVISGPQEDDRSEARVAGFCSVHSADVIPAGWFAADGERAAPFALATGANGIFCANDRIAEGLISFARRVGEPTPPIVGFDDAPIAEKLGITTIAIPWSEMATAAASTIRRRLVDRRGGCIHQVLAPIPVIRW